MRPSRVHENISWIEEQFLRGLSVHDFEPAPFEMGVAKQKCVTRKPINDELAAAACEQSPSWTDNVEPLAEPFPLRCPACGSSSREFRWRREIGCDVIREMYTCSICRRDFIIEIGERGLQGANVYSPPPIDHDALVAHTPSTMRMIDCGDDVRERRCVPVRFRGDGGNSPDHGDDGEPVDDGRFWFGFVVGVALSVLAIFCIQEFAR